MYPPINSPTSPQDVQMADLNILNGKNAMETAQSPVSNHSFGDHTAISTIKSTDTLRNNIDIKNELAKKRTSLILNDNGNNELANGCESPVSSTASSTGVAALSQHQQPIKLATVKRCSRNLDNARYRFDSVNNNRTSIFDRSSSSSTDSDSAGGNGKTNTESSANNNVEPLDNGKLRRMRRKSQADKVQSPSTSGTPSNESDADDGHRAVNGAADTDRCNGNGSDASTQKRDSLTSKESSSATSSDDYFLCEKFKNSINAKLCNDVVSAAVVIGNEMDVDERRAALELLSPHEGPLGRRYAEVATSKAATNNKW